VLKFTVCGNKEHPFDLFEINFRQNIVISNLNNGVNVILTIRWLDFLFYFQRSE